MATVELPNLERAIEELASSGTPNPEDWMPKYSPLALLWYTRECARIAAMKWVSDLQAGGTDEIDEDGILEQTTLGVTKAAAVLTACCMRMEMIEPAEGNAPPDDDLLED